VGILPKKIASNVSYMRHRNGPVDYKIWRCYATMRVRKKRFVTSMTFKNAWRKLGLTFNRTLWRLRLTSGATVWDHVCVLVADTLNTCCEIIVY